MLLNNHLRCFLLSIKRLLAVRSAESLDRQMKILNDQGAHEKALHLFDEYQREKIHPLSARSFTQALKACAQLGDLSRGSAIHQMVSSEIQEDSYLLASLINLYSKWRIVWVRLDRVVDIEVQCGETRSAQSLFDASEKKTPAMYGTMMKGDILSFPALMWIEVGLFCRLYSKQYS